MARTQGRLLASMWQEGSDFCQLGPTAQRLYMFLLGQPNLNHAGLLPLTLTRWARSSPGVTVESLEADLAELEAAKYVVIDKSTEEALVRTLVRNDGIWKQPKMMLAMRSDAGEIVSPWLRYRLREELLRIDTSKIPKQETRDAIDEVLADIIGTLPDTPPQGYAIPEETPNPYPHAGERALSSASTTATTPSHLPVAPTSPTRGRDEIWDSLLEACNVDPENIPKSARGAYNAAVKQLRDIGATPEEIRRRAAIYRGQWRDVSLTPTALVRRWPECERPPPPLSLAPTHNEQVIAAARMQAQQAEAQRHRKALP